MTYQSEVLADTPIGYWRMETTSAYNEVTSSNNTLVGTPTVVTSGVPVGLVSGWTLNGNQAINLGGSYSDFTSDNTWTIEAWFKRANAATADDGTIWRRDGNGKAALIRVHSNDVTNPGKVRVYLNAAVDFMSPSRVDNDAWHHLVITSSGTGTNAVTMYIDGTQVAQANGTNLGSMTGGTQAIGAGSGTVGNSEAWVGGLADVAIYDYALSSTRVSAHYNAANAVNGGYTAQAMTATATSVDPTVLTNIQRLSITDDAHTDSASPTTNFNDSISVVVSTTKTGYFAIPSPTLGTGEFVSNAILRLTRNGNYAADRSATLERITSSWAETTVTHNSPPTTTSLGTITLPAGNTGENFDIDITTLLSATNYGVRISNASTQSSVFSAEYSTVASRPVVIYTIATTTSASPAADPMVATSATLVAPAVAVTGNTSYTAQVMTANATLVGPTWLAEREVTYDADPMEASATWPTATGFSESVNVPGNPFIATAETVDVTVTTQRGPRVDATPMTATAAWKQAAEVNGNLITTSESEDKYFQRVYAEQPIHWYRMISKTAWEPDRMITQGLPNSGVFSGQYVGDVLFGRNDGPDNRHSAHFQGNGYLAQGEFDASDTGNPAGWSLEFSFRTTKANTFIMVGVDRQNSYAFVPIEIWLKDGKINYRSHTTAAGVANASGGAFNGWNVNGRYTNISPEPIHQVTGFRNLNDGEWHHVVIRGRELVHDIVDEFLDGMDIWIDGKFEIRRANFAQGSPLAPAYFAGFPDFIGGRPDAMAPGILMSPLPGSLWFEGDMSEVSYYTHPLESFEIPRHYYDFMGWNPIEADSIDAFAFMTADNKGRGNKKRALYLWWSGGQDDAYSFGDFWNNKPNMNPILGAKGMFGPYGDFAGFQTFSYSVIRKNAGQAWRDDVYDMPSLIDLEKDLNMDEYDAIFFGDWPDEGSEFDTWSGFVYQFQAQYERLLRQLRDANDQGIGLFITQPRLAVDLGIIDRVEWADTLKEWRYANFQGAAAGDYDYGAALHFPWNIAGDVGTVGSGSPIAPSTGSPMNTDPVYLERKAHFISDTHKNDRFRVRALVEGLTDIPSYMLDEALFIRERDEFGDPITARKYLHRLGGLQIGDEFLYHGSDLGLDANALSYNLDLARAARWFGTWAVPPGHVKAGTVVTTFGHKHFWGHDEIDNPYMEYATTIVLRPGEYLAGRRVGGKIFVNFSEQPNQLPDTVTVQILPGSIDDDEHVDPVWVDGKVETTAQRAWEYSGTRWAYTAMGATGTNQTILVSLPDGTTFETTIQTGSGNSTDQGVGFVLTQARETYPTKQYPYLPMVARGLVWLRDREVVGDGDVFPSVGTMTASATMPNATVVAERDSDYTAQPMRAVGAMPKVAEDETGEVTVVTLAMEAFATLTGYSNVISAAPMTANAEFVEVFDLVHTSGEQVVLTLHGLDLITVYLKEEE